MITKFFNTAGPVRADQNYFIPPLERFDLDDVLMLIDLEKYFLLHAPRQSGKTSTMFALRDLINTTSDDTIAIYVNVEPAQVARHDVDRGIKAVVMCLGHEASLVLGMPEVKDEVLRLVEKGGGATALSASLAFLCEQTDKRVVLIIDEIDSLIGDTLVSVLRQLRAGYPNRMNRAFPTSVILCGLVDIKDYKIHKSDGEIITGGSCFNIKSKSLTLGNFSEEEIHTLYLQHTEETGQAFDESVFDLAWNYTGGQPWLVNALAYQVCFEMKENRDRTRTITKGMFVDAKEQLILSRQTHLDQLADKLKEPRVRNVIEPMMTGVDARVLPDDAEYCIDLGLIKRTPDGLVVSNDIYKEVIPRELSNSMQTAFLSIFRPEWINEDQSLNVDLLMKLFVQFWRENSDVWSQDMQGYVEAAPHLVFFSFLQRVSNGHGLIEREYGLGMKRADLYLKWKSPVSEQRVIFEVKLRTQKQNTVEALETMKEKALEQTADYADRCSATESHILIFDRRGIDGEWIEKVSVEVRDGITIWEL